MQNIPFSKVSDGAITVTVMYTVELKLTQLMFMW